MGLTSKEYWDLTFYQFSLLTDSRNDKAKISIHKDKQLSYMIAYLLRVNAMPSKQEWLGIERTEDEVSDARKFHQEITHND